MRRKRDLTEKRFGRLTAVNRIDKPGESRWVCKCDCGNVKIILASHLIRGNTKSCGCLQRERASKAKTKHGERNTRLYTIWVDMRARCSRITEPSYKNYGGRGISVCKEWENSFERFREWSYQNGYDNSLTIDRIDNDGNYCPENCKWSTREEQSNNRRSNVYVNVNGETHTIAEWCKINGISYWTVVKRRVRGWNDEDAVSIPVNYKRTIGGD